MINDSSSSSSSSTASSPSNKKSSNLLYPTANDMNKVASKYQQPCSTDYLKLPQASTLHPSSKAAPIGNCRHQMPESSKMPFIIGTMNISNSDSSGQRHLPVNDPQLTQNQIDELKESIRLLNDTIFKDPNNRTRPPSEYIELYDSLTEKLHKSQKDLQELQSGQSHTLATPSTTVTNTPDVEKNKKHKSKQYIKKSAGQQEQQLKSDSNSILINNNANNSNSNGNSANHTPNLSPSKSTSSSILNNNNDNLNLNNDINNDTQSTITSDNYPIFQNSPNLSSKNRSNNRNNNNNSTSNTSINTASSIMNRTNNDSDSTMLHTRNDPYIRIFIGTSTYVIKRSENVILRDIVSTKIKTSKYEIDNCVAYIKENHKKLDWNTALMNIDTNEIFVGKVGFDLMHDFKKKSVTFRTCDSCSKRTMFTCICSKCQYTICLKMTCREKSEEFACHEEDSNAIELRKKIKDFSQQILPVNQLVVNVNTNNNSSSARDRSRSENDLLENLIDNPKTPVPNKQVTKSPTSIPKNMNKDPTVVNGFGTLPARGAKPSVRPTIDMKHQHPNEMTRRDSLKLWEIRSTDITTGRQVGSGSFGTVHEATNFYHGKVAIKYLNVQNPSPTQRDAFRNEAAILKETRHDNILLFIGYMSKPFLAIVTEWCEGSSLYRHLHVEEEYWNMYQLVDIAKQTGTGMEYLHARDILHRDLKSNNIFLVPDEKYIHSNNNNKANDRANDIDKWTVKIGDFGLATVKTAAWNNNSSSSAVVKPRKCNPTGSILWMAPEVIRQAMEDPYSQKSDIYSFGVVLYELVTCRLPYAQKEQDMILFQVGMGKLKPNPEDSRKDTPIVIKTLITQCCEFQRDKRPVFDEINLKLKSLKIARLQRAQSEPILFSHYPTGASIIDDEIYPVPLTPKLDNNLSTTHFNTNL